ncbi:MAG: helix-turn-helix transcriptional regulator [Moraxellaceae bacterium]|nr:helix-turn-helix transcriptional regulator [Moraxellaceae bacterium]
MKANEKLKQLRELNNWSQEYVSEKINITPSSYAKIERGETGLTLERLQQFAEIYNVEVSEIVEPNKGSFYQVNENSSCNIYNQSNINHTTKEVEKLQLTIQHKDELLKQQEKMLADKEREINMLNEFIQTLKNK